jgi:SWI/SNF-related matrix-associated actin-dependent regulator 1 of chromatin subfamily A
VVKTLEGRFFNAPAKLWTAPNIGKNIGILEKAGFKMIGLIKKEVFHEEVKPKEIIKIDPKKLHPELFPYQVDGVSFLETNIGKGLVLFDMGIGKTAIASSYIKIHPEFKKIIVICPSSIKYNWQRELSKWAGENSSYLISGRTSFTLPNYRIFIINYDILKDWEKKLIDLEADLIIIDECQKFGNHKSKMVSSFLKIAHLIERRIFLSGTPIRNRPKEFWVTLSLLDHIQFGNRWDFFQKFCNPSYSRFGWDFSGASNIEELHEKIAPLHIRKTKEEVLKDLPEKQKFILPLELDDVLAEKYWHENEQFRKWVEDTKNKKGLEVRNKIEYLRQLAYQAKRDSLIDWLKDLVDNNRKVVIFGYHKNVLDDIENEFKTISVRLDGSTPTQKRQEYIDQFQMDKEIKVFIGQLIAAGSGITLTAAHVAVMAEMWWVPADHEQAENRIHRIGTKENVQIYYPVGIGTVEETMASRLIEKYNIISQIIDGKDGEFFQGQVLEEILK